MTRSLYPYLLVSLGLHLLVLLALLVLRGPQLTEAPQRRVVIEFQRQRQPARQPSAVRTPEAPQILAPQVEPLTSSLDLGGPRALAVPSGRLPEASPPPPAAARDEGRIELPGRTAPIVPLAPELPSVRADVPAPEELLADIPGLDAPPAAVGASLSPAAATVEQERRYLQSGALEWRGRERKVLRAVRPEFPEVLRQEGLGVDVEASFTVAPNGQVTEVDITRSSGYASVDRAVVRALKNYLFEPSDIGQDDVGVQRFSYRLERSN